MHAPDREALSFADLEQSYPRFVQAKDIALTPAQRALWLDITPYINATPPVVFKDAPLARAFGLFRGLGMRHLVAVDRANNVAGILTRHDLTNHTLERAAARNASSADEARHSNASSAPFFRQRKQVVANAGPTTVVLAQGGLFDEL